MNLAESKKQNEWQQTAEFYAKKYKSHMSLLEDSLSSKAKKGGMSLMDVYALGKQLESWDYYLKFCEEQGNVNLLGKIPDVAYDVITAIQGASILPVVASVQPIDEERGTIYFKNVRTTNVKGSQVSAPSVVVDPRTGVVTQQGYASNILENIVAAATVNAQLSYSFTLAAGPVRSETLSIRIGNTAVQGKDIGNGVIWGNGLAGTVNYLTGAVAITLAANPGAGVDILVSYQQNYELATDIPQIDTFFDSKGIHARIYALKGTVGVMQSFGMNKRFGLVAEDELATDLTAEINKEIGGEAVRKLRAAALGSTIFYKTPSTGVSFFEHKQTYFDKLNDAEAVLVGNAGRGTISLLILGKDHAALVAGLPGFQKLSDGNTLGTHIFGTLNGITVVRVVEATILGALEGVAVWKGLSPFEAALVYSPFMPLTVTGTLPQSPNPLQSMRAAAVWAGLDAVVPQYATRFDVNLGAQP